MKIKLLILMVLALTVTACGENKEISFEDFKSLFPYSNDKDNQFRYQSNTETQMIHMMNYLTSGGQLTIDGRPHADFFCDVINVIDGDSISIDCEFGLWTVRYIDVDAPNENTMDNGLWFKDECYSKEATIYNKKLVSNREIIFLDFGKDNYNRRLGLVYVKDSNENYLNVNHMLVANGFARSHKGKGTTYRYSIFVDKFTNYLKKTADLHTLALANNLGLWGECPNNYYSN